MNFFILLLIISSLGGFGGFISSLTSQTDNSYLIKLPSINLKEGEIRMGCLGNICIGAGTSLAISFLAFPLFNVNVENLNEQVNDRQLNLTSDFTAIVSISMVAGFSGKSLLESVSKSLIARIDELNYKTSELQNQINRDSDLESFFMEASNLLNKIEDVRNVTKTEQEKYVREAEKIYDGILEKSHNNEKALIGLARCLALERKFKEAVNKLNEISIDNDRPILEARVSYNKACYKWLSIDENSEEEYNIDQVFNHLRIAINKFPELKERAREDKDFEKLGSLEEYKERFYKIIGNH